MPHRLEALPPTRWSVVARAGYAEPAARAQALDDLVTLYRPVLVQFLVSRLHLSLERAEDFVQTFLVEKLLEQNVLTQAAAEKGRFRSFILKVFANFVRDRLRQEQAVKRRQDSPDAVRVEDVQEFFADPSPVAAALDVLWARQVLARTIEQVRTACVEKQREDLWRVLQDRVLGPALEGSTPTPYDQLVARLGLRSPSEASTLLITARRMFVRVLRETVRETVADERDVEAEIRELKRVLQA